MTHTELKKKQKVLHKMITDFDAFCKTHGLRYFMMYGTLLGAVRHKGFIPWDYDMDIAMTRSEYNKFKRVERLLPSHLSIWEVCYSSIEYAGLSRLMYQDKDLGWVQLDVFILDYEKDGWLNSKLSTVLCRLLHFAKLNNCEKSILVKHFTGQPLKQAVVHLSKIVKILFGGAGNIERLIFKLRVSKNPTNNYITLESIIPLPTKYFYNTDFKEFEGGNFYAPIHAEELLTRIYGNYLEIPAEGHQWMKEEGLE